MLTPYSASCLRVPTASSRSTFTLPSLMSSAVSSTSLSLISTSAPIWAPNLIFYPPKLCPAQLAHLVPRRRVSQLAADAVIRGGCGTHLQYLEKSWNRAGCDLDGVTG